MTCTDPTGQWSFWVSAVRPLNNPFKGGGISDPGGYLGFRIAHTKTGYQLGSVVIGIVSLYCNAWMPVCNGAGQAAWSGFAGRSFEDSVKTGVISGVTSYAFQQIGSAYSDGAGNSTYMDNSGAITDYGQFSQAVTLHGVVGCVSSVASGGKCGPGALSASFSKAMMPITGPMANSSPEAGLFISAVMGGTGSVLGGGKFANGAQTAAFGYLFNAMSTAARAKIIAIGGGLGASAGVVAAGGCTAGTRGFCLLGSGLIIAGGTTGGIVIGSFIADVTDSLEDVVKKIHGNAWLSPDPTTVYVLHRLDTGEIWKFGITSDVDNPENRYGKNWLATEGLKMTSIMTFDSRAPAKMLEISLCLGYQAMNGGFLPKGSGQCH